MRPFAATNAGSVTSLVSRGRVKSIGRSVTMRPGRANMTSRRRRRRAAAPHRYRASRAARCAGRRSQTSCSQPCISRRVMASRAPNGSSSSRTRAGVRNVRSRARRWRMPPRELRRPGALEAREAEPLEQRARPAPRPPPRRTPATSAPRVALPAPAATAAAGRAGACKRRPRPADRRATVTDAGLRVGTSSPASTRSSVLLPQPLGPDEADDARRGHVRGSRRRARGRRRRRRVHGGTEPLEPTHAATVAPVAFGRKSLVNAFDTSTSRSRQPGLDEEGRELGHVCRVLVAPRRPFAAYLRHVVLGAGLRRGSASAPGHGLDSGVGRGRRDPSSASIVATAVDGQEAPRPGPGRPEHRSRS